VLPTRHLISLRKIEDYLTDTNQVLMDDHLIIMPIGGLLLLHTFLDRLSWFSTYDFTGSNITWDDIEALVAEMTHRLGELE
jgi:hypothetical protein